MKPIKKYPYNTFCWIDLNSMDIFESINFYTSLFNWDVSTVAKDKSGNYALFLKNNLKVCGVGEINDKIKSGMFNTTWNSYINVKDLNKTCELVTEAKGTIIVPPTKLGKDGKLAIITDSVGAKLYIWQAGNHSGCQVVNEPNTFIWNEISTNYKKRTIDFYNKVFEWDYIESEYLNIFTNNGRACASLNKLSREDPDIKPEPESYWDVFFRVDKLKKYTEKAVLLGATAHSSNVKIESLGRYSYIEDNQGGFFYLLKVDSIDNVPDNWY